MSSNVNADKADEVVGKIQDILLNPLQPEDARIASALSHAQSREMKLILRSAPLRCLWMKLLKFPGLRSSKFLTPRIFHKRLDGNHFGLIMHILSSIVAKMLQISSLGDKNRAFSYTAPTMALLDNAYDRTLSGRITDAPRGERWIAGLHKYWEDVNASLDGFLNVAQKAHRIEIKARFAKMPEELYYWPLISNAFLLDISKELQRVEPAITEVCAWFEPLIKNFGPKSHFHSDSMRLPDGTTLLLSRAPQKDVDEVVDILLSELGDGLTKLTSAIGQTPTPESLERMESRREQAYIDLKPWCEDFRERKRLGGRSGHASSVDTFRTTDNRIMAKYLENTSFDWLLLMQKSKKGKKMYQRIAAAASDRLARRSQTKLYLTISGVRRLRQRLAEILDFTEYLDEIPLSGIDSETNELVFMTSFHSQTQQFQALAKELIKTPGFHRMNAGGYLENDPVVAELVDRLSTALRTNHAHNLLCQQRRQFPNTEDQSDQMISVPAMSILASIPAVISAPTPVTAMERPLQQRIQRPRSRADSVAHEEEATRSEDEVDGILLNGVLGQTHSDRQGIRSRSKNKDHFAREGGAFPSIDVNSDARHAGRAGSQRESGLDEEEINYDEGEVTLRLSESYSRSATSRPRPRMLFSHVEIPKARFRLSQVARTKVSLDHSLEIQTQNLVQNDNVVRGGGGGLAMTGMKRDYAKTSRQLNSEIRAIDQRGGRRVILWSTKSDFHASDAKPDAESEFEAQPSRGSVVKAGLSAPTTEFDARGESEVSGIDPSPKPAKRSRTKPRISLGSFVDPNFSDDGTSTILSSPKRRKLGADHVYTVTRGSPSYYARPARQ